MINLTISRSITETLSKLLVIEQSDLRSPLYIVKSFIYDFWSYFAAISKDKRLDVIMLVLDNLSEKDDIEVRLLSNILKLTIWN